MNVVQILFSVLIIIISIGCGGPYIESIKVERKDKTTKEKVEVEAYLFDAKIRRKGKLNSFRLELFQTDSVIAIGGRGYLGKGALKGRLTVDSINVYFPTRKEYLSEEVNDLMASFDCTGEIPPMNLLSLFSNFPDEVLSNTDAVIVADDSNKKRLAFQISFKKCPWQINLIYDYHQTGWRIKKFTFSNGDKITIKASRREYKKRAKVSVKKFLHPVTTRAVRIIL